MKLNKYIIAAFLGAALGLTSCNDFDTDIFSNQVNTEQKDDVLHTNPAMEQAGVNAIVSGAYQPLTIYDQHFDFGLPSIMMMLDSNGQDFISSTSGYNWFAPSVELSCGITTSYETNEVWYTCYNAIATCNNVLSTFPEDTEDEYELYYRAQGHAFRAFYYWLLSQVYQQNYYGNETKPCVPVITEANAAEAAMNGIARNTVQEVYDQILTDLNKAIEILGSVRVKASDLVDTKPKRFFNLDTAYGMLARVSLTMHDYEGALEAASNCLETTNCQPYSIAEVSQPSFISLEDSSWLLGQPVATTDAAVTTGIINFPSMMGTFTYGYAEYGAWRWCNKNLYDWIPVTDVRKGWFLDKDGNSPNINDAMADYISGKGVSDSPDLGGSKIRAYTQVKYAPYGNQLLNSTNASDIPYFRIEEVYYIYFEALAMTGNTGAAVTELTNFVQKYRNPSYRCKAKTAEEIQDEIWMQRRVEFWGEGLVAWFDLKRLGKPIDRIGATYPSDWVYYVEPGTEYFVLPIPQQETQTNKLLTAGDNNPQWSAPSPVAED